MEDEIAAKLAQIEALKSIEVQKEEEAMEWRQKVTAPLLSVHTIF